MSARYRHNETCAECDEYTRSTLAVFGQPEADLTTNEGVIMALECLLAAMFHLADSLKLESGDDYTAEMLVESAHTILGCWP